MPQRTLRFKIRQDGLVEESVEGISGNSCYELTEKLEQALGTVQRRVSTTDAYVQQEIQLQPITADQIL